MKVDSTKLSGVTRNRKSSKSGGTSSVAFSDMLGGTSETSSASETSSIANVATVFAAQEVGDREGNARKARERAEEMLERLEAIRDGLLMGAIPQNQLHSLATAAKQDRENFEDPRLGEILTEIELRARVELAKLERTV